MVDPGLETLDGSEVAHELAVLVHRAQIVAYLVHLAAEFLAVDDVGKLAQVAAIVPEKFPLLGLGFVVDQVALVLFDPLVHGRDDG